MGHGTGAIMAVPGQDTRDHEFARLFGLPVIRTVAAPDDHADDRAFTGEGAAINSANDEVSLNGLGVDEAKIIITEWLQGKGFGQLETQYKLRDWLFSRQRYWGEPFPIVHDADGVAHALPDSMLPLTLPEMADFSPVRLDPTDATSEPRPPLGRASEWATVRLDLGDGEQTYTRELNVMPQWAGSCWYELRYLDPTNADTFCDPANERYWMGKDPRRLDDTGGVDLYVGGVEHAVLHLLYSRFWHKVLFDLGSRLERRSRSPAVQPGLHPGLRVRRRARGACPAPQEVVEDPPGTFVHRGLLGTGATRVREDGQVAQQRGHPGRDLRTLRRRRVPGVRDGDGPVGRVPAVADPGRGRRSAFSATTWRLVVDEHTGETVIGEQRADPATERLLHGTIDAVGRDYRQLSYHTAIARLITLTNHLSKIGGAAPRWWSSRWY